MTELSKMSKEEVLKATITSYDICPCGWMPNDYYKELLSRLADYEKVRQQYQELIYAVGNKYQNETRHETALRYIRKAEEISDVGACKERIR